MAGRVKKHCLPKKIVTEIRKFAREKLSQADIAHNFEHAERVASLSERLAKKEKANLRILIPAAYLHDVVSREEGKDHNLHVSRSIEAAKKFLQSLREFSCKEIETIAKVMLSGASEYYMRGGKARSIEERILRDAGILDAIGAVGIARVFGFGGHFKKNFGHPTGLERDSVMEYINLNLLLRSKRLTTDTGKVMGHQRSKFLKKFIQEYRKEYLGEL